MTWEDRSKRHDELPGNWKSIRAEVLERDHYACQGSRDGKKCGKRANQVDHKKRGDDHSLGNLQSLCKVCHAVKSSVEGNSARWGSK